MTTAQDQQSRAEFEAWAKTMLAMYSRYMRRIGDGYETPYLQAAWNGWQAARSLPAGEPDILEIDHSRREAESLAWALFNKHYAHEEPYASGRVKFGLLDSLRGVLSQIDNMTCGLARAAAPMQEPDEPAGYIEATGERYYTAAQVLTMGRVPPEMPAPDFYLDGGSTPCFYASTVQASLSAAQRPPAAQERKPLIARQLGEWHEDDGPVAWWAWCGREWAGEPAWIGTPNGSDWPGYHTHWTPHPELPAAHGIEEGGSDG